MNRDPGSLLQLIRHQPIHITTVSIPMDAGSGWLRGSEPKFLRKPSSVPFAKGIEIVTNLAANDGALLEADEGRDLTSKNCLKCGRWSSRDFFHRNKSKTDGRQANCKKCVAAGKKKKYLRKKKEIKFRSEVRGRLQEEVIANFSEVFSEAIITMVENGQL